MLCLPARGFVVVDATPDIERLDELALVVEKVDWPILPSSLTPFGAAVTKVACATALGPPFE